MSEPAKDEAELMKRVAEILYDNYDIDLPMAATLKAIRAAGWDIVPAEVAEEWCEDEAWIKQLKETTNP